MGDLNRRQIQRGVINRTLTFVNGDTFETATLVELRERLRQLKSAFEKFQVEHSNICEEAADAAALEVQEAEFASGRD